MHPSVGALQGIERLPIVWDKCKWIIKVTGISSMDGKFKIAKFSRTLRVTFSLMSLSRNLPLSIIERIINGLTGEYLEFGRAISGWIEKTASEVSILVS